MSDAIAKDKSKLLNILSFNQSLEVEVDTTKSSIVLREVAVAHVERGRVIGEGTGVGGARNIAPDRGVFRLSGADGHRSAHSHQAEELGRHVFVHVGF